VSQRKSDGMWRGQIDVGYRDGKRQRKTVYAKTKKECIRRLEAAKDAVKAGDATTSTMKVEKWLRYWLTHIAADNVKPSTLVDYRSKIEQYLVPSLGRHRLDRLTAAHVRAMHTDLRERGLSATTVHHAHRVLANALSAAMPELGLPRNVAALVRAPAKASSDEQPLTPDECRRVLDAAGGDRARWLAAIYTGARQGECLGLQWDRVDLEIGVADISWSLQRIRWAHGCHRRDADPTCGKKRAVSCPTRRLAVPPAFEHRRLDGNLCLIRPKTEGSIRLADLAPGLVYALTELQARDTGPNPHNLVFHRPDGRPIDGRADWAEWTALLKRAGVPHRSLHDARHTAATIMQSAGVPEAVRMQMLGHSQAATARRYAHVDRTLTRSAALALEAAITER
jgi:integrase